MCIFIVCRFSPLFLIPHHTSWQKRKRQICAKRTIKNILCIFSESQQIINDITFSNISQDNISLSFSEHTNLFCIFFLLAALLLLFFCLCVVVGTLERYRFFHPLNLRYQWYNSKNKVFLFFISFYFSSSTCCFLFFFCY